MRQIDIKLNLDAVAPLLDVVKAVGDTLDNELAAPQHLEGIDADLRDSWREELITGQNADVATLLGLFDSEFFSSGTISLYEGRTDPILRACAAVRLRLRESHLSGLTNEALENDEIRPDEMPDDESRAFLCYLFLAKISEVIVEHFDPEATE
jgi:hypothetical protein